MRARKVREKTAMYHTLMANANNNATSGNGKDGTGNESDSSYNNTSQVVLNYCKKIL